MQEFLAKENSGVIPSMGSIRKSLKKALNVGQGLGIITMTEEVIRVPFSFRRDGNGIRAPVTTVANVQNEEENDDDFMDYEQEDQSSSRRKSGQPKKVRYKHSVADRIVVTTSYQIIVSLFYSAIILPMTNQSSL